MAWFLIAAAPALAFEPEDIFDIFDEDCCCPPLELLELMDEMDIALFFGTGDDGAEEEEKLSPGESLPLGTPPPCAEDRASRLDEEFFILDLMSR